MNTRTAFVTLLTMMCAVFSVTPAAAEDAKAKNKELIDFTRQDVDRDGAEIKVNKRYGWASGTWEKNLAFIEGRGLLVNNAGGKGNMGGDKSFKLSDYDSAYLIIVIGSRNQGKTLKVVFTDADGTEAAWFFPLTGKPLGTPLVCKMPLAKPDATERPGKDTGLDKSKIRKWQIAGDWQEAKFEVLLVKLGAMSP